MKITAVLTGAVLSATACVADLAFAAGVVGTGEPASCTETVLAAALTGGGVVTFDCGPSPVTIPVTHQTTITKPTSIDGGGLVTLSGSPTGVFEVRGKTTLSNLVFSDNTAAGATARSGTPGGGAIRNFSTLVVTNCTFSRNSGGAAEFALGGAIENIRRLTVSNSTFVGNTAGSGSTVGNGGAIYNGGTLTLSNSTFSDNAVSGSSGGFVGVGGAIGNLRTLTVSNSTFAGNSAGSGSTYALGGAIYNQGTLRLSGATFSANAAVGLGGAIYSSRTLTLSNSTFSGNDAAGGGALEIVGRKTMVTNCTFAANGAGVGTEISNDRCRSGCGTGRLTLRNTVVDNASGGNCAGIPITDGGNNLDSSGLCGLGPATDPMLDAAGLATNGGPTQTIALEPGSPAINAGNEAVCAATPVGNLDQRGFGRPGAAVTNCSIGAYEFNSPGPP
jgi:predicted outer membrane repeat protein